MNNNEVSEMNLEVPIVELKKGFSGSTLKLIAIITMLIDHTAATILDRILAARGMYNLDPSNALAFQEFASDNLLLFALYATMRLIGRLAFPIFCFLLVEGFLHTRNVRKYAIRLAMFALISEIPFDLAIAGKVSLNYQNVFFTLLIGLLVMVGFKAITDNASNKKWLPILSIIGAIAVGCSFTYATLGVVNLVNNSLIRSGASSSLDITISVKSILAVALCLVVLLTYVFMRIKKSVQIANVRFANLLILISGMFLAEVITTDYSGLGVLTIAVMYGLRKNPFKSMLGGCITLTIMSFSEAPVFFNLIVMRHYNGKRGLNYKYVFYLFYPVHLLLLYVICYFMKLL